MIDYITEAEALSEIYPIGDDPFHSRVKGRARFNTRKGQKFVNNADRYRCLATGCNPVLRGEEQAAAHRDSTGHRTAKWPVRSADGRRKERERQKNGYYDKYNVGAKSYGAREHLI